MFNWFMQRFSRPKLFTWRAEGSLWRLYPSNITVQPTGFCWTVFDHDRAVMPGNYTHLSVAQREAWVHATAMSLAYFGHHRIELRSC